jgi:hypothetical protein
LLEFYVRIDSSDPVKETYVVFHLTYTEDLRDRRNGREL